MKNKDYKLYYTPLFQQDLNEIIDYYCVVLQNPQAAENLLDEIDVAVKKRVTCPLSYQPYPSKRPRKYSYHRIYVRNYTIFYVVIEEVIEVRRIIYSARDILFIME